MKEQGQKKFAFAGIFSVLILTVLDQLTKYLAIRFLMNQSSLVLIPGVLELSYLENRGMAFGMFQGRIPFFVMICVVFFAVGIYFLVRMPKTKYYRPLGILIIVLLAGALGNFLDRIFRGYVVDFIYISLIHFPTFNLADIYVTCGAALLLLFVFVKYRDEHDFDFLKTQKK